MKNFNELTPAQTERFALLMEEMAEAQQVIGKILRHGRLSYNPLHRDGENSPSNADLLDKELGHVLHAIDLLCDAKDVNRPMVQDAQRRKADSIARWLHHQAQSPHHLRRSSESRTYGTLRVYCRSYGGTSLRNDPFRKFGGGGRPDRRDRTHHLRANAYRRDATAGVCVKRTPLKRTKGLEAKHLVNPVEVRCH